MYTRGRRDRSKVFTFLTEHQPEVRNRGRLLSLGELCADDHEMQHAVTNGSDHFAAMSLRPERLASACRAILGCELGLERGTRFMRPNADLMGRLLKLHETAGAIARTTPELFHTKKLFVHLSSV